MNKKRQHRRKMAAPVIITLAVIAYLLLFAGLCLFVENFNPFILAWMIIPFAGVGVAIYVLVERIREIRSGEEDDLSQY